MANVTQQGIDQQNTAFWSELCGSALARSIGVTDGSPDSLRRFDAAYMDLYPYLPAQLRPPRRPGEPLLEIGLGYGTVSQRLAEAGFGYHGLDIAAGPVGIVRERLQRLHWGDVERRVVQGSALEVPHPDATFDHVVSIGCLHHTGDLPRAVREIHRVLRPGGTAMVMLYNRHSLRQLVLRWQDLRAGGDRDERRRRAYDVNAAGEAAPATVFVTARQVRQELFAAFSDVRIERLNFDPTRLASFRGRAIWLSRERALPTVARVLGLDLYIHARK
jgi:ubiquinone/menaquinone biosynthesis C-methylase UbiE